MSVFKFSFVGWVTVAASVTIAACLVYDAYTQPDDHVAGNGFLTESQLSCQGCNLIFLNIELLRADHVGLISPEQALTPVVDKFFENGIHFLDATSASGAT